jgi:phospholipid/cholesterol/gamma-HCH transport system permease protein
MRFLAFWGGKVNRFTREFLEIIFLFLRILNYFPRVFKDRKQVVEQMAIIGSDSLPLVLLIGIFTGAIAGLEATALFDKFNLLAIAQPFVGASIANAVFTELTPVLTALVIAGRVGASMTAQLGSMNVTEQIDALEMMAIDKDRFLGMPRVFAALTMMPVLAIFSNLVAIIGAFFLIKYKYDFNAALFFESIVTYFVTSEIMTGILKSTIFGIVTVLIGVHVGFKTTGGAEGVGKATVRSYTLSAASILIIDAIMGGIL